MIRAVIADDSAVAREHLRHLLEQDPELRVVATAADGDEAVELVARLRPDVVLMDVHMPRLDGHAASRLIMESTPVPIVIVSARPERTGADGVFDALEVGALAVVEKPVAPDDPRYAEMAGRLVGTVKLMAGVKVVRRWPRRAPLRPAAVRPRPAAKVRVIAIGASTGGPPVVAEILAGLGPALPCPVLLVQHIAPGFVAGLAEWLGRVTRLPVLLPDDGEAARPGIVYVAGPGKQMGIRRNGRICLSDEPPLDGFAPSASYLLSAVARSFGASAVGVLLTGMGRDGAAGLHELRLAGGRTFAQDEATSVVFGMPKEAIRLGAADHVLPPGEIVRTIRKLVG